MREHEVNKLNNFIAGWYLEDTSICDEILHFFEVHAEKRRGVFLHHGNPICDLSIKDSVDASLDELNLFPKYGSVVFDAVKLYNEKYKFSVYAEDLIIKDLPNIQYYPLNGGYHIWHSERTKSPSAIRRCLVYMTYLNDVTDGGETEWYYQNTKIKPEKGLTVIWPTDWMFTHKGLPSPTQEKFIITGWLSFR